MGVNTLVPIMIFRFISTKSGLVPVYVKNDGIYGFQVHLEPLLKCFIHTLIENINKILGHSYNIKSLVTLYGTFHVMVYCWKVWWVI